jgi:hypothetical protein
MARGSGYDGVVDAISYQLASGIDAQMQRFPFLCNELSSSIPKKTKELNIISSQNILPQQRKYSKEPRKYI